MEHQVESPRFGEIATAFRAMVGIQLVFPKTTVALAAFHQGIGKVFHMAAGFPNSGVHQDGGVQTNHVIALHNHRAPPRFLDVALQFNPQRAVVPGRTQAAVHLAGLKHETPPLG